MFKNYFKTAFRNLSRNKSYAAINIIGLAVGIAACLLIFFIIQFQTSFDNFHHNSDRIYRVVTVFKKPDGTNYTRGTAFPVAQGLRIDFPQLENVARINGAQGEQITVMNDKTTATEKKFKEQGLFFAEPEFFQIFNFPFLAGNAKTALAEPYTAVLTQQAAEKYFGNWQSAIGKYIRYGGKKVCRVTGILKNTPVNTDFPLQVVMSFKTTNNDTSSDWVSTYGDLNTFVVLPKNMSPGQFNKDLQTFVKKHKPAEYVNDGNALQPLNEIHYDKRFGNYNSRTFSKELITALSMIGLFLLIIACVNFINLATAQAVNRSKEVGVRKVLGSNKWQLVFQFLSETFLITVSAVIIAIGIAAIALPFLNRLLEMQVQMHFNATMILFLAVLTLLVTILSGLYPAIVLSGFNPITALKSKITTKMVGGISLRRALVVLQFTIAQALIIGTLIVVSQMDFFKNASMGFDKDAVVAVPVPNDSTSQSKFHALKDQLLQQAGIKMVSFSTFTPADDSHWGSDFKFDNSTKKSDFNADLKWADVDYFKVYNLQFIAGKPYDQSDTARGLVVNEMLVKKLGIQNPENILGKKINFWDGNIIAPVVGVVKNFNGTSLAKPMAPIIMGSWKDVYQVMNIRIQPQSAKQTLGTIEKLWNKTFPDFVYEYKFLDDKIAAFYKQEDQLSQLYKIFAAIAIFISCLGLYGLVSFMVTQRTKEVGIRKVLGASAGNIVYLFSKEFTVLIAIAFLIATPAAYYFMHQWLQDFSYRINIGAGIFLLTIFISVIISWLAVGYRAIKAAVANPVKSLRTE
jgi:putative ABC transport system permease protein